MLSAWRRQSTRRRRRLSDLARPVENIWDDRREKFFANIVFESMDAVENKISEACLHYEENPETVRSITAFPWIDDNL